MIVAFPPLGAIAALNEELVRPVAAEEGYECNAVWFARRSAWCAQGALLLGCMRLRVIADSLHGLVVRLAHHAGVDPSSRFGPAWRG
jgi:hypothetical protein